MPVTLSSPDGDDCSTAPACGTDTSSGTERSLHGVRPGRDVHAADLRRRPVDGGADRRGAGGRRDPRADRAPGAAGARGHGRASVGPGSAPAERRARRRRSAGRPDARSTVVGGVRRPRRLRARQRRAHEHREPRLARGVGRRRLGGAQQRPRPRAAGPPPPTRGRTRRSTCSRCWRPACRSSGSTTATATSASPPTRASCARRPPPTGSPPTPPTAPNTSCRPSRRASRRSFPGSSSGSRAAATAGRELFVYLNLAHQTGQAPVHVLSAKLDGRGSRGGAALGRLADADRRPLPAGRDPDPGQAAAASDPVHRDRSACRTARATLTRRWSFTTR